ncbi:MAG: 50S ribosomal protein L23 [Candidatus Sericytochromatia bacterium]
MTDLYTVIKRPLITEKNAMLNEQNTYCFEVDKRANKIDIARAAKLLFNVEVVDVNTSSMKRTKKVRKRTGLRTETQVQSKKAFVKLAEGNAIDFYGSV